MKTDLLDLLLKAEHQFFNLISILLCTIENHHSKSQKNATTGKLTIPNWILSGHFKFFYIIGLQLHDPFCHHSHFQGVNLPREVLRTEYLFDLNEYFWRHLPRSFRAQTMKKKLIYVWAGPGNTKGQCLLTHSSGNQLTNQEREYITKHFLFYFEMSNSVQEMFVLHERHFGMKTYRYDQHKRSCLTLYILLKEKPSQYQLW